MLNSTRTYVLKESEISSGHILSQYDVGIVLIYRTVAHKCPSVLIPPTNNYLVYIICLLTLIYEVIRFRTSRKFSIAGNCSK